MSESLTQTAKILKLLKAKGRVTNFELRKIAWRYPARILDLKHEGHKIRSVHDKGAKWFYIYDGHADDIQEAAWLSRCALRLSTQMSEQNGDIEFILNCWNCHKDFSVWIGLGNLNASIFTCPHCKERNEIE